MPRKLYLETFGCQMNVLDSELVLGQLRARATSRSTTATRPTSSSTTPAPSASTPSRRSGRASASCASASRASPAWSSASSAAWPSATGRTSSSSYPHVDVLCGPGELDKLPALVHNAVVTERGSTSQPTHAGHADRQVALMGATIRRSSTLAAAEDNLELLDLSRSDLARRRRRAGVRPHHARVQQVLHLLRRPLHARPGGASPAAEHHRRGPQAHRRRRARSDAARADDQPLPLRARRRPQDHLRRAALPDPRSRARSAAAAVRHQLPARFHRRGPAGHARLPAHLPLPARPRPARQRPHPEADEPRLHRRQYRDFIDRARGYMPDVCIASDFIVGFPTETDEEFEQTVELVRRLPVQEQLHLQVLARARARSRSTASPTTCPKT